MGEGLASIHTTCHAEASGDRRKDGDNSLQYKLPSSQFLHSIKLFWLITILVLDKRGKTRNTLSDVCRSFRAPVLSAMSLPLRASSYVQAIALTT